ncbi:hypothetical protein PPL_02211 [Heterostelium album PN500]|uniref:DUF155 domain-containing protein n=1 Tax=Heterostelium pallidum (strain ATCC 26659 / Pp 5 / PN500) TaxID=670386 RepID=D3B1N7_HETP5|nr:hypothetical protein PPL_02211 [Heterostelium album PN500]EFA85211.1 hypothetical protein PPL_02211 [Heterostelium album PN500]|eukprot:XP_020437320.1 hypothetical protein PPL_02211 [Heterostelium album PN500]
MDPLKKKINNIDLVHNDLPNHQSHQPPHMINGHVGNVVGSHSQPNNHNNHQGNLNNSHGVKLDRSSPTETAYKKKRIVPSKAAGVSRQNGGLLCAHSSRELRRVSAYCVSDSLSLNQSFHHIDQIGLNPIEHKEFFYFTLKREPEAPPMDIPIPVPTPIDDPIGNQIPTIKLDNSNNTGNIVGSVHNNNTNSSLEGANFLPHLPKPIAQNHQHPQQQHKLQPPIYWNGDLNDQIYDPSKLNPPSSPTIDSDNVPESFLMEPIFDLTRDYGYNHNENGLVVIFEYGVVVFWDLTPSIEFKVIKMLDPFRIEPLDHKLVDDMKFEYSNGSQTSIFQDKISLDREDVYVKIAMSHSISQSVKLSSFEENLEKIIVETKQVPVHLSKEGKICLSQKRVGQLLGNLYIQKNAINLHSNLLDTPEFFWEYQQYESYHHLTEKYLEIKPRVRTLNHRLMVVRDLIDMCRADIDAKGTIILTSDISIKLLINFN